MATNLVCEDHGPQDFPIDLPSFVQDLLTKLLHHLGVGQRVGLIRCMTELQGERGQESL